MYHMVDGAGRLPVKHYPSMGLRHSYHFRTQLLTSGRVSTRFRGTYLSLPARCLKVRFVEQLTMCRIGKGVVVGG